MFMLNSQSLSSYPLNTLPQVLRGALVLAGKIPGAWHVQIKDAGHAIMVQYPAEVAQIVNTFLSTTSPNN
jgi:hypothetical protein